MAKRWAELTTEYASRIKHYSKRKIRLSDGREFWAFWNENEKCFIWDQGESAAYAEDDTLFILKG
jgi:hypothetical protein